MSDSEPFRDHFPDEELPGFNFRKLTGKIVDNWYWFLISLCLSLVVAWCITGFYPPLYAVKGSILINDHRNSFLTDNNGFSGQALQGFSTNHRGFYNQMILLKSKPVIAKVIQDLGLEISYHDERKFKNREIYKDAPFRVVWDKTRPQWVGLDFRLTIGPSGKLRLEADGKNAATYDYSKAIRTSKQQAISIDRGIMPGEPVFLPGGCIFTVVPTQVSGFSIAGSYHFMFHSMQELIGCYRAGLSVELPDHETSVIDLVLKDYHEQKGMDFINQLVEVYQMDDVERKNQFADRTIRFIDQLLLGVRDSLEIAGRELLSFRASTQIVDISAQSDQLLEQLGELDREKIELGTRAGYLEDLKNYILENCDSGSFMVPASASFSDPILGGLISDYNRLTREKAKLNRVKSAPRLNQLNTELSKVREAMLENIDNVIAQNDLSLSQVKSRALVLARQAKHLPATERDLVNIERKYNLNNNTYNFLLGKLSEAQIAKASNQPESQIVEAAESLGMVAPRKGRVYEIGILAGLAFPFLIIFFHVLQNSKIVSKEDVEAITKYPVLGMIFFYKSAQKTLTPLLDNPNSPVNEPYRSLRYKLDLMVKGKSKPVIAVTSTSPGEGKTFTAINIASTYALTRKKTVMVDLDLRNSKISETFGLDPDNGVVSYIMGQKSLDDIIVRVQHSNFHIIPAGPIPPNPGEMLMDDKIAGLMYELKSQFDVVIIDSAPVGYVADLFQITDQVDSLVFVARDNFTQRAWLKQALEEMKAFRLKGVGIVINAVKQGKSRYQRYGYGYGYGYSKH